jgi:hypothetical protein
MKSGAVPASERRLKEKLAADEERLVGLVVIFTLAVELDCTLVFIVVHLCQGLELFVLDHRVRPASCK